MKRVVRNEAKQKEMNNKEKKALKVGEIYWAFGMWESWYEK